MGEFVSFLRSLKILPDIILPQETFLKSRKSFKLQGYRVERLDRTDDRHGEGIRTCIGEDLAYSSSAISEDPECLITSIITGSATMKIVNFYVPPGKVYSNDKLQLILNHSSECLICGDLNARSPMFGVCLSDSRGKIVEELEHKNNLVALNTGMRKHLSPNGSSSAIDVALASPNKALKSTWKVLDQNLRNDHYVIHIVINEPAFREEIRLPSINMKSVN